MSKRVATVFRYRGDAAVQSVALVGSWDSWKEQIGMKQDASDSRMWETTHELEPGHVTFKFVVDGTWTTGGEYGVEADGFGGENNALDVVTPLVPDVVESKEDKEEDVHEEETNGTIETTEEEQEDAEREAEEMKNLKGQGQGQEPSGCTVC